MNRLRIARLLVPVLALFAVTGCFDRSDPTGPGVSANRIEIIEDEALLSARVIEYPELLLELDQTVLSSSMASDDIRMSALRSAANHISFKLVAEVAPPEIGGVVLEATHVTIRGPIALVSYGKIGSQSLGAIDLFLVSNPSNPRLIASARFKDTDILSIETDGSRIYAGEATADTSFASPATVELMRLSSNRMSVQTIRASVPGFVVNDLAFGNGRVYVTSASTGGITALDAGTLQQRAHDPFPDARAVGAHGNWVVAVQGSPGRLRVYSGNNLQFEREVAVGGLGIPGSKSEVEVADDHAFVALGDGGTAVVNVRTGVLVATLPRPTMQGVATRDAVTNALTISGRLLIQANGGSGVWVNLAESTNGVLGLTRVGRIRFAGPVSSNYVVAREQTLFVAAGRGGLKIVRFSDDGGN